MQALDYEDEVVAEVQPRSSTVLVIRKQLVASR